MFTMKFCTDVLFGSSFVLIRLCTRQFCMFVISSDRDGAQCDIIIIVGVAVSVCLSIDHVYQLIMVKGIWGKKLCTVGCKRAFPVQYH